MQVLLLTMYFEPDIAANAVIMSGIARELVSRGHQVTVVTAFPHYSGNVLPDEYRGKLIQREEHDDLRIIRTYLYTSREKHRFLVRFLNYVSFNLLSTLVGIFSGPQEIILAPSPPLTIGLSAAVIGFIKRIPYIYNVQDINPDVLIKLGILKNKLGILFSRWLEKFVYRNARQITVLSDGFRQNLLEKGVPEEKITIIPNFVDSDFLVPLPRNNSIRERWGLLDKFVVLYAGNIGHSLDYEIILKAAESLSDWEDVAVVVVGSGSCKPRFVSAANSRDLENIYFYPFQPHELVPEIYAAADVALVPLKEGIALDSVPSKIYTIMASMRPVLAAVDPRSDAWQIVKQTESGFCVPPGNSEKLVQVLIELKDHPEVRQRCGEKGRSYVKAHHTPKRVGEKYHQLLIAVNDDNLDN